MILPYLLQKEFKQMWRNRLLPVLFVLLPVALMNLVPRVATQEVHGLKFVCVDADHSTLSRRLVEKVNASTYLALQAASPTYDEAKAVMDRGETDLIIEIPHGFERAFFRPEGVPTLRLAVNATNGMKGAMAQNYVAQIAAAFSGEIAEEQGQSAPVAAGSLSFRYLYNTRLDYKLYMVPCIFGLMLMLIVGFLPALNIVGEKERGTMEQVNVTPIGKADFILSKLIPYQFVGLLMTALALLAAWGLYGIVPVGSLGLFFLFVLLFCVVASAFGLIISNYSSTVQQAALTMFFFLVIFILMSGLLTPVRSMPPLAQWFTYLNPLRYLIDALRAIYIKGADFMVLSRQFVSLCIYAAVCGLWAVVSYRKSA